MNEIVPVVIFIEDEKQIRRFVRITLETAGYRVFEADTVYQGLIETSTRKPDLVILDLGLPDRDGIEFIHDVRSWSVLPIIVLSARAEEEAKIVALDAGADDYLTKPFGTGELLARIRATLRRSTKVDGVEQTCYEFGEVRVDLVKRIVERKGQFIHLTPIEYRLLMLLIRNVGRVLTQRQILRDVWGPSKIERDHYLRIFMSHLRHKLEQDPTRPQHILTETGVGYRFIL